MRLVGVCWSAGLSRTGVEHGFLTPSVLASLDPAVLGSVKAFAAGGEAVPASLVARWGRFAAAESVWTDRDDHRCDDFGAHGRRRWAGVVGFDRGRLVVLMRGWRRCRWGGW